LLTIAGNDDKKRQISRPELESLTIAGQSAMPQEFVPVARPTEIVEPDPIAPTRTRPKAIRQKQTAGHRCTTMTAQWIVAGFGGRVAKKVFGIVHLAPGEQEPTVTPAGDQFATECSSI
jgi:hypothetical protein